MMSVNANDPSRYNEVVIDYRYYQRHLPHSVEAFWGDEGDHAVHAAFLEYYGLTSRDVPLLSYTGQGFVDISP